LSIEAVDLREIERAGPEAGTVLKASAQIGLAAVAIVHINRIDEAARHLHLQDRPLRVAVVNRDLALRLSRNDALQRVRIDRVIGRDDGGRRVREAAQAGHRHRDPCREPNPSPPKIKPWSCAFAE